MMMWQGKQQLWVTHPRATAGPEGAGGANWRGMLHLQSTEWQGIQPGPVLTTLIRDVHSAAAQPCCITIANAAADAPLLMYAQWPGILFLAWSEP